MTTMQGMNAVVTGASSGIGVRFARFRTSCGWWSSAGLGTPFLHAFMRMPVHARKPFHSSGGHSPFHLRSAPTPGVLGLGNLHMETP